MDSRLVFDLEECPSWLQVPGWPHSIPNARKPIIILFRTYQSFFSVTLESRNSCY